MLPLQKSINTFIYETCLIVFTSDDAFMSNSYHVSLLSQQNILILLRYWSFIVHKRYIWAASARHHYIIDKLFSCNILFIIDSETLI